MHPLARWPSSPSPRSCTPFRSTKSSHFSCLSIRDSKKRVFPLRLPLSMDQHSASFLERLFDAEGATRRDKGSVLVTREDGGRSLRRCQLRLASLFGTQGLLEDGTTCSRTSHFRSLFRLPFRRYRMSSPPRHRFKHPLSGIFCLEGRERNCFSEMHFSCALGDIMYTLPLQHSSASFTYVYTLRMVERLHFLGSCTWFRHPSV